MKDPIGSGKRTHRSPGSYLRTLKRRRDFLKGCIERHGERRKGGDHDRAEYHALEWAIEELETLVDLSNRIAIGQDGPLT